MTTAEALATIKTFRESDAASTGYLIEFFSGYAILTSRTNWQGQWDNQTWRAEQIPSYLTAAIIATTTGKQNPHKPDLRAAVTTWLETTGPDDWQLIRKGYKVGG
jgi:hypothetical protein